MSRMSYEEDEDYTYDDSDGDVDMTQEEDDEQGTQSSLIAHSLLTSSIACRARGRCNRLRSRRGKG
jgi:hypothetical protein